MLRAFAISIPVVAGLLGAAWHFGPVRGVGASLAGAGTLLPAVTDELTGEASVIDGDTIEIDGQRVRLEGIDAPEAAQRCTAKWVGTWPCGREATRALMDLSEGRVLTCRRTGTDRYGRFLGVCFKDGLDINAEMVRRGLAWAFVKYSSRYVGGEEAEARGKKIGIWQANTMPAWDYRANTWARAAAGGVTNAECVIKGNVTRHGRIYHMPWSPWYDSVNMAEGSGKCWFCDEAEAREAGWRPAMGS